MEKKAQLPNMNTVSDLVCGSYITGYARGFPGREVVTKATDRVGTSRATAASVRPLSEQINDEVAVDFLPPPPGNNVQIRNQRQLF